MRQETIVRIRDHRFTKERKQFEYETKFAIASRKDALACLNRIVQRMEERSPFVLVRIPGGDKLVTRVAFFAKGNREYTSFAYRGARMLKVKRHRVLTRDRLPIFKNDEWLLIDRDDFTRKLSRFRHRFARHSYRLVDIRAQIRALGFLSSAQLGVMEKTRVKHFVLDARDGRVYAVAVTHCVSGRRIQRQLEVEYSGYIPGVGRRTQNSERQIIARTVELSKHIVKRSSVKLTPSTERKFTFVVAY
jgi:hypothetical protein